MLKKASIFGALAATLMIAPTAAFAGDQVTGSNSVVNQGSVTVGDFNTTGQNGSASTYQDQFKNQYCGNNGNQVAGSNTGVGQGSTTIGFGNTTGQNANSSTGQTQSNACYFPF